MNLDYFDGFLKYRQAPIVCYGFALLAVVVATGLRLLLNPLLEDNVPYITYFFAITLAGWMGGGRPAAFAVMTSAVAAWYFFVPTPWSVMIASTQHRIGLIVFIVLGGMIALTCEAMKRAQRRAMEQSEATRRQMLEVQELRRIATEHYERIRTILTSITQCYAVFNKALAFEDLNPQAEAHLGMKREELVGRKLWEVLPGSDKTPLGLAFLEAQQTKAMVHCEVPSVRRRGQWIELHLYPNDHGLAVYWRDITDRKKIEEALRGSEERLRAMFKQAAVGIALLDCQGRFLEVNERLSEIVGYCPDELLTLGCADLTCREDWPKNGTLMAGLVSGDHRDVVIEERYVRRDGSMVWVNVAMAALMGPAGLPDRLVAIIQDINRRKQAEEALRKTVAELEVSESSLHEKVAELEKFHDIVVGRELKMIVLEKEIEQLKRPGPSSTNMPNEATFMT
jgi:PAS domain S-box-containing protein